jgi:tetratricopeptide (TPR) repeat protein
MIVTVTRVSLLHSLRFLAAVSFLALPWVTASRCFGQERPPQTEEEKQARQDLNQGTEAFRNGQYKEAERYFAHAKQLYPRLMLARLYLATTYASQYIPGAPSEENIRLGHAAVEEFRGVLDLDAQNISAIDGLGSLLFQMAGQPYNLEMFQESKSYHLKHAQIRPDDPEPYYWVGVIDWTLSYRANADLRGNYNRANINRQIRDTDPFPATVREEYRNAYGPMIDEGIAALKHAIQLRPVYDDAMAYLNLLYRRKADAVASRGEREQLMKMADDLVDKVMEIKQRRAEAPTQP